MKYRCPKCDYKMSASEADAAYDGCPSCRHRIEWGNYLDTDELIELENNAVEERNIIDRDKNPFNSYSF